MAFVKLDTGILTSSLWIDRGQRDIFITALLLAVPRRVTAPMHAIKVWKIEPAGFVVPAGEYGFIHAAAPGIIRMALMGDEEGRAALEALCEPDPHSRTADFEGRRMARVDGGFVVLNYMKYRDKDHTAAERMRRYRDKGNVTRNGDGRTRNVTQAEAEAERGENAPARSRGSRLTLTALPDDWREFCRSERPDLDPDRTFAKFCDYWCGKPGTSGRKSDWPATWRNWVRDERAPAAGSVKSADPDDWRRRAI
jgi:hypothetical protein